jgi:hypothetical protein
LIPIAEVIETKRMRKKADAKDAFVEDSSSDDEEEVVEEDPEGEKEDKELNPRKAAKKL